jgi:DNA-binding MarR family transcriptional regulator
MAQESELNIPGYVREAIGTFHEIMSATQKDMFENMNRANKGELCVLHFLSMNNAAVIPSELSAALQSSAARVSTLLGSLEKKGQIEREIDKNNRRNILVTITESGRERAKTEMMKMETALACVFTEMGETDTVRFLRLIERFFGLMQKWEARS